MILTERAAALGDITSTKTGQTRSGPQNRLVSEIRRSRVKTVRTWREHQKDPASARA
jgi:hypothetical protein